MQEIIVYRNPAEAAFWHSMQSGAAFPVMMGCVAFFLVFVVFHRLGERVLRRQRRLTWNQVNERATYIAMAFGIVAAILTVRFFWI